MESKNMTEKEFEEFQKLLERELGTVDSERESEITEMLRREGAAHDTARPAAHSVRELAIEKEAAMKAAAESAARNACADRYAESEAFIIEEMQRHDEPAYQPKHEAAPVPEATPVTRGKYEKEPSEAEEPAPQRAEDFFRKPGKYEKVSEDAEGYFNPELPKETASQRRKRVRRNNRIMRIAIGLAAVFIVSLGVGLIVKSFNHKDDVKDKIGVSDNVTGTDAEKNVISEEPIAAADCNILSITPMTEFTAILEGDSQALKIGMTTKGEAGASDLDWVSSDETVATVTPEGVVTGEGAGVCTITITAKDDPSVEAKMNVTVRHLEEKDGVTYVDGILILNKSYDAPAEYDPGGLTEDTKLAFDALCEGAAIDGCNIYLGSGYRSYSLQSTIFSNYTDLYGQEQADTFSARAGHSEHQSGLAIDVNTIDDAFGATPEAAWLREHAHEYGFIIRYAEDKTDITGYKYEPWHIRYVGTEVATEITELGLSLEEYLGVDSVYAEDTEDTNE